MLSIVSTFSGCKLVAYPPPTTVSGNQRSNEELMLAYAAGEASAFRELFDRYAPVLLGLGRRHLRSEAKAQDLVQKTFMRLHSARYDFVPGRQLHPWLLTIAMNLIRDEWRTQKRKPTTSLEYEPAVDSSVEDEGNLATEDRVLALRKALSTLSELDRLVLELRWFQERSFAEIAQVLGISQGAARVRAHRASTRLKQALLHTDTAEV